MIRSYEHAESVQRRRREAGLKGRSKAIRRWFKRRHGVAIDACCGIHLCYATGYSAKVFHTETLEADFTGCGKYNQSRSDV